MDELKMDDFKAEIDASFRRIKEGDVIKCIVLSISEAGMSVDLGTYTEGFIPANEVSNNPRVSIRSFNTGDEVTAIVLDADNEDGYPSLSIRQATDLLAWEHLKQLQESRTIIKVKVQSSVNAGVIAYLDDIRGFIPASMLALNYVEDVEAYVGKEVDVIVVTVDQSKKKLILSAKEVERERYEQEKNIKISSLQKGLITKGTIEKIMPYGAFITIDEGLSGLVHISQICEKHIKSPNEVLKLGDEVSVKIIDVKDGKISLSMKAVSEDQVQDAVEDIADVPLTYSDGGEATTGLGDLLKNLKF